MNFAKQLLGSNWKIAKQLEGSLGKWGCLYKKKRVTGENLVFLALTAEAVKTFEVKKNAI